MGAAAMAGAGKSRRGTLQGAGVEGGGGGGEAESGVVPGTFNCDGGWDVNDDVGGLRDHDRPARMSDMR